MRHVFTIVCGKIIRHLARLRGGGSALPGLFVEKVDRSFIPDTLNTLPRGIVVISGTNGKTTTTKMVVELLESQGLTVFTNKTGSNFVRGVAAALLADVTISGKLHADIAVLELDEAHAVQFIKITPPTHSLLLNVMRDQLDRFGEIDTTAKLLEKIAQATTKTVIINREDNRLTAIGESLESQEVYYFGLNPSLTHHFPNDDDLHQASQNTHTKPDARLTLEAFTDSTATFSFHGSLHETTLQVKGAYNIFNAAGALSLVQSILPEAPIDNLVSSISSVTPAFGRGESFIVDGTPIDIVLVKNPAGFRLGLSSFNNKDHAVMIAINDNYADGRDMSWLWDVDFHSLQKVHTTSGIRAYDMTLRLAYDDIIVKNTETDLKKALSKFLTSNKETPKRIYCTYTAMLAIRKELSKIVTIEDIL